MKTMWPTENAMTSRLPWNTGEQQVRIDHLRALTGRFGLFEHTPQDVPPVSPGYTTVDNARAPWQSSATPGSATPTRQPGTCGSFCGLGFPAGGTTECPRTAHGSTTAAPTTLTGGRFGV